MALSITNNFVTEQCTGSVRVGVNFLQSHLCAALLCDCASSSATAAPELWLLLSRAGFFLLLFPEWAGGEARDGEGPRRKGHSIHYGVGSAIKVQGQEVEEGDVCIHGVCVLKQ